MRILPPDLRNQLASSTSGLDLTACGGTPYPTGRSAVSFRKSEKVRQGYRLELLPEDAHLDRAPGFLRSHRGAVLFSAHLRRPAASPQVFGMKSISAQAMEQSQTNRRGKPQRCWRTPRSQSKLVVRTFSDRTSTSQTARPEVDTAISAVIALLPPSLRSPRWSSASPRQPLDWARCEETMAKLGDAGAQQRPRPSGVPNPRTLGA